MSGVQVLEFLMRNDFSSHAPSATMAATGSFVVVPSATPFAAGSIRAVTISGRGRLRGWTVWRCSRTPLCCQRGLIP